MSKYVSSFNNDEGLTLCGYQKKLKTMKKKFFVLYKDTLSSVARLEYYDSEKKFKSGVQPKRVIKLKNCFNINRRLDTKYDYVIALATKEGGFGIVLETKDEMLKWLEVLISLQRCDSNISNAVQPYFEHVWQVIVQKKGLAEEKGIIGSYHICLTAKSVTFLRIGSEKTFHGGSKIQSVEFLLTTIRRCGDSQCFFYLEVGRQSAVGPGELWMETEDPLTAQNMHCMISSAMSSNGDLNLEPMRKRSSSANEASKPINVLQKKQSQADNQNSDSPQPVKYYGRERCDSLPSRQRTSSECSTQSLTTSSVYINRNNAIQTLRPHSYQRHSSSPPTSATIACSESEESSISIDEPDDNGSFMAYRFNTRTSGGVIPEENSDDLINTESKNMCTADDNAKEEVKDQHKFPISKEEHYVSMAPAKNPKSSVTTSYLNSEFLEEINNVTYICPPSSNSIKSDIKFAEYCSDVPNSFPSEFESQKELPARTYSIGNKIEYNKINARMGNDYDQNTRVRAFSVGSRAKIPRCDLQRGVLLQNPMLEDHTNSNNNISSVTDGMSCYNINFKVNRDKKSTSAPLLIHKSQSSVDKMGDLMEIDFSKISNTNNRIHSLSTKTQISKSVPYTSRDRIKKNDSIVVVVKNDNNSANCLLPSSVNSINKTDNGYLEMKPVGNPLHKSSVGKKSGPRENLCTNLKLDESGVLPEVKDKFSFINNQANKLSELQCSKPITIPKRAVQQFPIHTPIMSVKNSFTYKKSPSNIIDAEQFASNNRTISKANPNLTLKYSKLTLGCVSQEAFEPVKNDDYVNIDKSSEEETKDHLMQARDCEEEFFENNRLAHSVSDKDYKYDKPCTSESGYEILQIKSDSSLQSYKKLNRPTSFRKEKKQFEITPNRPRSTNSPLPASSLCTVSGCSSSTSCLNHLTTPQQQQSKKKTLPSRPPSFSSENVLYYASLDLPQCSWEVNPKCTETLNKFSQTSLTTNNLYAKIDFDHSDSSSSSSKNVNS